MSTNNVHLFGSYTNQRLNYQYGGFKINLTPPRLFNNSWSSMNGSIYNVHSGSSTTHSSGSSTTTSTPSSTSTNDYYEALNVLNNMFNTPSATTGGSSDVSSGSSSGVSSGGGSDVSSGSSSGVSSGGGSIDTGAGYSGVAQGLSTNSSIDSYAQRFNRINDGNYTNINRLNELQADMSGDLATAQADYSNIQGQYLAAQSNITRLEGSIDTAKDERDDAQTQLNDNTSNLNSSVQARDNLDDQLSSVNDEYKSNCEAVKSAEKEKSSAQKQVSTAKTSKSQADAAVTAANQTLSSAEATLQSTPQTLEDGSPNPQYQAAKTAVNNAKTQLEQAQKAQQEAEEALDAAEGQLSTAQESLTTVQDTKKETLQNLQETDSQYKDMAKNCEQLQTAVENSQEAYDSSLTTFDDASANYTRLNEELQSQKGIISGAEACKTRLDTLQAQNEEINATKAMVEAFHDNCDERYKASQEEKAAVEAEMYEFANATEGVSSSKTPMENRHSLGAYSADYFAVTRGVFGAVMDAGDIDDRRYGGYISNSDGSITFPSNGYTYYKMNDGSWFSPYTEATGLISSENNYYVELQKQHPEVDTIVARAKKQLKNLGYG